MPKLIYGVSISLCAHFLKGQVKYMVEQGYEVIVISGPGEEISALAQQEGARLEVVDFSRAISPLQDMRNLIRVIRILRKERPDVVNAGTPKAGFLIMLACWLTGVRNRIFTLHGMVSDTQSGLRKKILRAAEKRSCALARKVVVVSPSLLQHAVEEGVLVQGKGIVIGHGSCNGVDVDRFNRSENLENSAMLLGENSGLPRGAFVIGFVGRLSGDKGIDLLFRAFNELRDRYPTLVLLLVGPLDDRDPFSPIYRQQMADDPRVFYLGKLLDVAPAYPLIDLLVLASYREGFGNVLIEAASMGIPVIAPDIPGCRDAVANGKNGTLFMVGNKDDLVSKVESYVKDPALCSTHGRAGRVLAMERFAQLPIWKGLAALYKEAP